MERFSVIIFWVIRLNDYDNLCLTGDFDRDIAVFKQIFKNDDMLRIRTATLGDSKIKVGFVFFDGMADNISIDDSLVRPCIKAKAVPKSADIDFLLKNVLYAGEISKVHKFSEILTSIINGDTAIILENSIFGLTADTKGWEIRSTDEPDDERVLQGPREGFNEAAIPNIALIRRKLQTPDLCIESEKVGKRSKTAVYVCYLGELADKSLVEEIKNRIKKIDIDGVLDSNYIAEFIRNDRFSIFKTTGSTERPDIVAARLLEGRVAVVVDGTPVVITFPYLFCENFQSDEDYYVNYYVGSVARILRYVCFFLSISIPGAFVALTTYHSKLLPTEFMITVAELRSGVPFSSVMECFLLITIFEILRETGLRTPQSLGSALSIVGGLVIGDAAITARIVSAPMLIAVSFSGVAGLMLPRLKGAVFYLRLLFFTASALLGLYGYMLTFICLIIYIHNTKTLGAEYTETPEKSGIKRIKDTVIRVPWFYMRERPLFNRDKIRMGNDIK